MFPSGYIQALVMEFFICTKLRGIFPTNQCEINIRKTKRFNESMYFIQYPECIECAGKLRDESEKYSNTEVLDGSVSDRLIGLLGR